MYSLKETEEFENEFKKIPKDIKLRFENQFKKVAENPYSLGKPLGYKWFRELKNKGYRVYYIIYDKEVVVLFVGVSGKKTQQKVIDFVNNNLESFKDSIKKEKKL